MSEGLLERDPLAFLPKMRTTPGIRTPADNAREVLELADVRRLVTDPQVKHPEVWAFLLTTGCRVGEAAAVTANDIRAHGDVSVLTVRAQKHARWGDVRETKAVSVREVVMPTWAVPTKFPLFEVSESRVLQWWHADLKRLGIASRRVHATRHTFITVLARLGVGVEIIRDMTHPRGSDAFSQYLHPEFNQKIGAARRLSTAILGE
jgi:integrase